MAMISAINIASVSNDIDGTDLDDSEINNDNDLNQNENKTK